MLRIIDIVSVDGKPESSLSTMAAPSRVGTGYFVPNAKSTIGASQSSALAIAAPKRSRTLLLRGVMSGLGTGAFAGIALGGDLGVSFTETSARSVFLVPVIGC